MSKLKIASVSVTVGRDGKSVNVPPGTPFAFTDEEKKDVIRGYGEDVFRDPVNESPAEVAAAAPAAKTAEQKAADAEAKTAEQKAADAEAKKAAAAAKKAGGTAAAPVVPAPVVPAAGADETEDDGL